MLTSRTQIQAIANRLAGLPDPQPLTLAHFSEPYLTCWRALDSATPENYQTALIQALQPFPEGDRILGAIFSARPGYVPRYPSLAELAPSLKPIEWIWRNWIPRGMITLLGAVSGAGKSFLALELARRILHDLPFPDGSTYQPPSAYQPSSSHTLTSSPTSSSLPSRTQLSIKADPTILYVDAEAVPQLINERAARWHMDTSRLYLMLPDPASSDGMIDFSQQPSRDQLTDMAITLRPHLIIIDSLSSISSKGENNIEDVRAIFGYLNQLAQGINTGLLLIHHFRKGSSMQPRLSDISVDDVRGSGHIIAIARSVLGLSIVQTEQEPNRNGPRKLEILKTNLGPYPDPLGFEYAPLHPQGVYLRWTNAPEPYREPTQLDAGKTWLEEQLRAGPQRPSDLETAAAAEGISRATLYRAREHHGAHIQNTLGRRHPQNHWQWLDHPHRPASPDPAPDPDLALSPAPDPAPDRAPSSSDPDPAPARLLDPSPSPDPSPAPARLLDPSLAPDLISASAPSPIPPQSQESQEYQES